ncbi:hypothetical protein DV532_14125 [Pseudomonas sp. Leaf58]|nr:hypothetical protein DV532_14125 [Pseudomonas sp. Leaf58]
MTLLELCRHDPAALPRATSSKWLNPALVGAGLPANTGAAGARHRVGCFAGMPAPPRVSAPPANSVLCAPTQPRGLSDLPQVRPAKGCAAAPGAPD